MKHEMRQTKKLTLSALMCALTVVILLLASFLGDLDLTVLMLSSFGMVFVYLEIGAPYTYLTWCTSTLLTFLLLPGRYFWILYFFIFGIYPILKGGFERLPRLLWLVAKLAYFNAVIWVIILLLQWLLGFVLLDGETAWWNALILLVANIAFVAYDCFISVVVRLYVARYRDKLRRLFF